MEDFIALAAKLGLTVEVNLVGKQQNVPGTLLDTPNNLWDLLTGHETGNPSKGADARMHRNFVANGGGEEGVSYTFSIDKDRAVQILPINQCQYAQGTTRGNRISLSFEMAINADGDFEATKDNFAKLAAALTVAAGRTTTQGRVVQHNVWYGKDCPMIIRHTPGAWEAVLAKCEMYTERLLAMQSPPPPPPAADEPIVLNGHTIKQGFLGLWKQYGIEVLGLPMSDEYTQIEPDLGNKSVTYQDFENVVVQWYDGIQPRICAGIRRYKYNQ